MGRPPHRRSRELRDAQVVHRGHRPLQATVRRGARGRRARPPPRVPVHQVRDGARRGAPGRRAAPPRAPGGVSGRARGARSRGGGHLRRHGLRRRRHGLGRRAAAGRPRSASSARACSLPVRLPGGAAAVRQPWRMACAWLTEALGQAPAMPRELTGRVDAGRLAAGRRAGADGGRLAADHEHGQAVRRRRRAVRHPRRGQLRRPGRRRARGALRPGERRAYTLPAGWRRTAGRSSWTRGRSSPRSCGTSKEGVAIPLVAARFHNAVAEATARACVRRRRPWRHRDRGALRRRLPEPPAARAHVVAAPRRRAEGAAAGAPASKRRRHRLRPARGGRGAGGRGGANAP